MNTLTPQSAVKSGIQATRLGSELQVGDVITVNGRKNRITNLQPYEGNLASLWNGKARIAELDLCKIGITIDPDLLY